MTQDVSVKGSCRVCETSMSRDTAVCPSCGTRKPWVPEQPTVSPWIVRFALWSGGVLVGLVLLFVAGMLVFGPVAENRERGHTPPSVGARPGEARP